MSTTLSSPVFKVSASNGNTYYTNKIGDWTYGNPNSAPDLNSGMYLDNNSYGYTRFDTARYPTKTFTNCYATSHGHTLSFDGTYLVYDGVQITNYLEMPNWNPADSHHWSDLTDIPQIIVAEDDVYGPYTGTLGGFLVWTKKYVIFLYDTLVWHNVGITLDYQTYIKQNGALYGDPNYIVYNNGVNVTINSLTMYYGTSVSVDLTYSPAAAVSSSSGNFGFHYIRGFITTGISTSSGIISKFIRTKSATTSTASATYQKIKSSYRTLLAASSSTSLFSSKGYFGSLWSIIFAGAKFIGVKVGSSIAAITTDGKTWATQSLPTSNNWAAIASNGTTTIAIARDSNLISKTTDGVTWTNIALPTKRLWNSIAANGSTFVAVSLSSNFCAVSIDNGATWAEYSMPLNTSWTSICYGNSLFVAVGEGGACATSSDGLTWTTRTMPNSIRFNGVTWALGQFTAVGSGPTQYAAKSTDGVTWTRITMPKSANWRSVGQGYNTDTIV